MQLFLDQSFEDHCRCVGDMNKYDAQLFSTYGPRGPKQYHVTYVARHVPDEVLEAVRADPAVELVEYDWDPGSRLTRNHIELHGKLLKIVQISQNICRLLQRCSAHCFKIQFRNFN